MSDRATGCGEVRYANCHMSCSAVVVVILWTRMMYDVIHDVASYVYACIMYHAFHVMLIPCTFDLLHVVCPASSLPIVLSPSAMPRIVVGPGFYPVSRCRSLCYFSHI